MSNRYLLSTIYSVAESVIEEKKKGSKQRRRLRCLVYAFKQPFSVFKQHFTYFNTLFYPRVFPQMFLNNNFQFLNTHTKRVLIFESLFVCLFCFLFFLFLFFFYIYWKLEVVLRIFYLQGSLCFFASNLLV